MFHLHRYDVVRRAGRGNSYQACRCGDRRIVHRDRNRPMDHSWLERGTFREMPTRGTTGGAGEARAR
jgi:hypothetical protein